MISRWERFIGKQDIGDSRPWDLTEIVPAHETRWFRTGAAVLGFGVLAAIIIIVFL